MTPSEPIEQVTTFLEQHGYKRLPSPLMINRTAFRFPAALGGAEKASDLILVADSVQMEDADIARQVLGFARALDIAQSSNPLTTVVVGPRPSRESLDQMMAVCRVLSVGTISDDDAEQTLTNWLAVLTPIGQITANGIIAEPLAELRKSSEDLPQEIADLIVLSGSEMVEEGVNAILTRELEQAWEQPDDPADNEA